MKLIFILSIFLFPFSLMANEQIIEMKDLLVFSPLKNKKTTTLLPVKILEGYELEMKMANSIGETLKQELGVHNASFGAGVGQPVIRGQTGSRVKVLQNSLGSLDVSNLSPDHANSTEPLLARSIEIIKGAASLLYSSGTLGGIVNVLDNRIPEKLPEDSFNSIFEQRFNSVSDETSSVLSHDGHIDNFAWHLDGFYRQRNDVSIAGSAINEAVETTVSNTEGFIANSEAKSWSGTLGASWIDDWGFVGFSVNYLDNHYGIPPVDEQVRIDLKQTRYDMKAEINQPFSGVKSLKFRLGVNDYQHNEIEADGLIGTKFLNDGVTGRVELAHQALGFVDQGVIGFQIDSIQFSAIGTEAFIPPSEIDTYALFALESLFLGDWQYEIGLRAEHQRIAAEGFQNKTHTALSASMSALWTMDKAHNLGLSFSYAQRAPDVQELFANGVHFATRSYSQGQRDLKLESSYHLELNFTGNYQWGSTEINLFHSWTQNYIHQQQTGQLYNLDDEFFTSFCATNASCLPVLSTRQNNAHFYGFEAKILLPVWESDFANIDVSLFGDYVRGKFSDNRNVPRLPPLRYGLQLDYNDKNNLSAHLRFTHVEAQNHAGDNESPTSGHLLLSTAVNYQHELTKKSELILFVKGNNLLNENSRNANSYLRNFAPEAGRGVELGFRISF